MTGAQAGRALMTAMLAGTSVLVVMAAQSAAPTPGVGANTPAVVRLPAGAIQPQVVTDSRGRVHVLFFKGEAAHGDLFYARLDDRGALTKAVQVNNQPGSAIATGTMRGGHLAIGRDGRVHVAWAGSDQATPRAPGRKTPLLYTRLNAAGTAFEPERNVVQQALEGLDGGSIAADPAGHVYVAWHAFRPGLRGEADRRVWVSRSSDDGHTFARETPASEAATGACGCCGIGALADRQGTLFMLYRAARETTHRDTYLLTSRDRGVTFASEQLQPWDIAACPMSTFTLVDGPTGVLAAWETAGQVQWLRLDPTTGRRSAIVTASGPGGARKHPSLAANVRGETLLVWADGTGWNRGGALGWERYDRGGRPAAAGALDGVPNWSLGAVAVRPAGEFVIIY